MERGLLLIMKELSLPDEGLRAEEGSEGGIEEVS